ncbi:MAG TPA: PKD domain-containing protein, partial [Gaiellaceae bacterium]|nr:PKD domain-containing protein [Gaiellaceae bacterium]
MKDFLAHAADIITKARAALDSIHLPKLVSNGILGLDDAANVLDTVGNGFTFIEDRRDVLLITQNKNWRPTFTSNFGYSPTLPGAPAQLAVPVSVPSYKWDAYTSFTRTEISAIAFDIGALVTGKVEAKQKNPLVKAALFAASQTMGFLAGRGHDAAKAMYIAAYDPATDYQTPPTVSYTSTDRLDSLPNGPMKDWAVAYSHALDVEAARDQAIVRYAGAVSAGDDGAQAVQLGALQDLTAQEQSLLASNPQGEQDLLATLPADLTTADQQEVLSALADPNFASSDIGQIMVAAGADPGEVAGLAQDAAQVMTPGDSVDLRAAVADGLSQQSGLLQDSAADTSLLLADTDAAMGKPAAVVELDQAAGEDGMFHGTVTATISSDSSYPAADHFEYALDGGAFARYTGAVPVFGAGHHVLIARAVAADGTVQDPPTTTSIDIAQPHSPPIAEIGEPNVIVAADHGLPVTVTLDGSRSHDQNGDSLSYSWSFDDPSGTTADTTGAAVTHTFSRYGGYTARLSVNNGYYTTAATANIEIVDVTAPTLTAPNDLTIRTGADAADKITAWLASATATDDGGGAVTITNDYTETGAAGTRTTVTWTATDSSGNSAKASATLTLLDGTPPVITPVLAGTTGDGGWYTSDVNLNWQVADPESPITATSGCEASIVSVDTNGTTFTCTATSTGGTSTQTVTVRRDTTPPEIKPSRTPAPNAAGWNKTNVTAVFDCTDAGSDIATCPAPVVFHEGANQNATVTATDKAANKASYTVTDVNVDTTPPLLHGTATTAPNDHGWYSGDVTIHWTCDDTGSGIAGACPADATIGGEGASLASTATVRDIAGNTTAATSSNVRIDRAPPVTEASAPSGWSNTGVTVMLTPSDNLAGVDATYFQLDDGPTQAGTSVSITDEGVHAVAYWSVDLAGNVERQRKIQVRIDKTAPTITHAASPAANDAGWNRTDVTVTFSCADALSGIAFCTPAQLLTTDG